MNHRSRKAASKKKSRAAKKKTTKNRGGDNVSSPPRPTWVDNLRFRPVVPAIPLASSSSPGLEEKSSSPANTPTTTLSTTSSSSSSNSSPAGNLSLSVISWNVLAHAYCSRRSQVHLPPVYQKHVFEGKYRRNSVVRILKEKFGSNNDHDGEDAAGADVICLQEVDMDEIRTELEKDGTYVCAETPRAATKTTGGGDGGGGGGAGIGSRVDSCSVFVRQANWRIVEHELVRFDDLATLSTTDDDSTTNATNSVAAAGSTSNSNLQGLQQSFLRRNVALLVRIEHVSTGETVVIANCHLYWNPGYEYVKLCQAHYVMVRARQFCRTPDEKFVMCGDLNSKPGGAVQTYLSNGSICAKQYAPWYRIYDRDLERQEDARRVDEEEETVERDEGGSGNVDLPNDESGLVEGMRSLGLTASNNPSPSLSSSSSSPRYMLDATLNKLCRWLRILGLDTALETDEEEKLRTGQGRMVVFERCRNERRTLVTTSTRLQCRADCPPGTYLISPTFLDKLEVVMVHMLLTHGVVLEPEAFLTRCVICNGGFDEVHAVDDKRRILSEHAAPVDLLEDNLEVFQCDGCGQGYWWCDRPTSSASRIKGSAKRLFQLCLRAGIPIRGPLSMMDDVDVDEERRQGWDHSQPGSDLLRQKLDVVDWLRSETLQCPFQLESAYARKSDDGKVLGETIPFTNVTHDFVNTLDYVFSSGFTVSARLQIPTTFSEMNERSIEGGHLIPSDVWPSDHLPVGARLSWQESGESKLLETEPFKEDSPELSCSVLGSGPPPQLLRPPPAVHSARCSCGCVPNVPSLFEMAELRRKARLAKP